jgi:hypothetical protein
MNYGGASLNQPTGPVTTIEFPATVIVAVSNMTIMATSILSSRIKLDKKMEYLDELINATLTITLSSAPIISVTQYVNALVPAGGVGAADPRARARARPNGEVGAVNALVVDDPVYADLAAFNAAILPRFTAENIDRFFTTSLAAFIPERSALVRAYRKGTNVNTDDYDPCLIIKLKLRKFKEILEDLSRILRYSEEDYEFDETVRGECNVDLLFKKHLSFFLDENGHMEYRDLLQVFKNFMRVMLIFKHSPLFARQSGIDVLISALNKKIETYTEKDRECSRAPPARFTVRQGRNGLAVSTPISYPVFGQGTLTEIVELSIGRVGINNTKKFLEYAMDGSREKITRNWNEFKRLKEIYKERGLSGNILDLFAIIVKKASLTPRFIRIIQSLPTLMFSLLYNPSEGHFAGASQSSQYEENTSLTIDEMINLDEEPVIDPSVMALLQMLASSAPRARRLAHRNHPLLADEAHAEGYSGNVDRRHRSPSRHRGTSRHRGANKGSNKGSGRSNTNKKKEKKEKKENNE